MAKFELEIITKITKDGAPFHEAQQKSYNLEREQLLPMEKDLVLLRRKWEDETGVS